MAKVKRPRTNIRSPAVVMFSSSSSWVVTEYQRATPTTKQSNGGRIDNHTSQGRRPNSCFGVSLSRPPSSSRGLNGGALSGFEIASGPGIRVTMIRRDASNLDLPLSRKRLVTIPQRATAKQKQAALPPGRRPHSQRQQNHRYGCLVPIPAPTMAPSPRPRAKPTTGLSKTASPRVMPMAAPTRQQIQSGLFTQPPK